MRPEWRQLSFKEQDEIKQEFTSLVEEYQNKPGVFLLTYCLIGLRANADLMFWRIAESLDVLQEMASSLMKSNFGKYFEESCSFLSITKRSSYVDKLDPSHQDTRINILPGQKKYIFVYPFVKTREWYRLTFPARQGMMDEHIQIGNKYPTVKLNTTYSFGIDDQDFVVAFETDNPVDFVNLVQELRETEASRYTKQDTPMFTGIMHPTVKDALTFI